MAVMAKENKTCMSTSCFALNQPRAILFVQQYSPTRNKKKTRTRRRTEKERSDTKDEKLIGRVKVNTFRHSEQRTKDRSLHMGRCRYKSKKLIISIPRDSGNPKIPPATFPSLITAQPTS